MVREEITNNIEFKSCISKINKWYLRSSKLLTIKTIPYNSSLIYSSIINEVVRRGGNVIYIWGESSSNYELIKDIKNSNKDVSYSYIEKGKKNVNITFVNFKNMIDIRGYYDLCIIDDISSFSLMNREELMELVEAMYIYSKRIIIYTIERIVSMGEKLDLTSLSFCKPFVEPRIINTRVNLSKDIPYILYDYLIWFKSNKRKVIIYTPSQQQVENMAYYYSNIIKFDGVKIYKYFRGESINKLKSIFKSKDRATFIITNYIGSYLSQISNKDIVVILPGERFCSYKKIIYLCAEVGRGKKSGEILLVSNYILSDMEKAKEIAREFNKKIWEKGLLK